MPKWFAYRRGAVEGRRDARRRRAAADELRDDGARARRRAARDRRPVRRDQGELGGYYLIDVPDLDAALDVGLEDPERRARLGRGAAGDGVRRDARPAPPGPRRAARSGPSARRARAVLATLARQLGGDIALAEDALQDALADALVTWSRDGAPRSPGGLDHDGRAAAGDRPPAPRAGAGAPRRAARALAALEREAGRTRPGTRPRTSPCRTTACGCCSRAATRRWRWTRASR